MSRVDFSRIPQVLHGIQFMIAEDPEWDPYDLKITEACARAIVDSNAAITDRKILAAQKIRNYIRRYPKVPMFKNHLWRFYFSVGFIDMALQAAEQAIQENPTYFYGKLMLANTLMLIHERWSEIPALLQHRNIVTYAGREELCYHEVLNYYVLVVEYHLKTKDLKAAQGYLYFLEVAGFGEDEAYKRVKGRVR